MRKLLVRAAALTLSLSMIVVDASAVVKEVELWGAKSINDMGSSDRLISMDDLKEDYSGFLQTDGMTEFFHKDQDPAPKTDMNEALAWLIDNEILLRDETITVTNVNGIPSVSITKADTNETMFYNVRRSDALMYIYKAVFGPLDGRTVAVETPNVRTDNGSQSLFSSMIAKYSEWVPNEVEGESIAEAGNAGSSGSPGSGKPPGDPGMPGSSGGSASNDVSYTNDANKWRYTPQGDEYTSVFGDTNVFISENHFDQNSTGGNGGAGGDGGDGAFMGGNGGDGGRGGDGGDAENNIYYETDYKSIYFVPGADLLFYRTNDVVEMYLQSLLSKGLLSNDPALKTTKFEDTFIPLTEDGAALAGWSGSADPYVVNMSATKRIRLENVAYVNTTDVLGVNFIVRYNGNSLTISRNNIFDSDTGYFDTEETSRMDVYRYIYNMVYANEKKLSDLERDIVNYKYGMEFDGIASEEDANILKYLVAKGILDFNGSDELSDLYGSITWYDFIPILYRVANPDARLDFSVIQLTDSEQAWKAKGFSPQTVYIAPSGSVGDLEFQYDQDYLISTDGTQSIAETENTVAFEYDNDSSWLNKLRNSVLSIVGINIVHAAPATVGTLTYKVENSGAMTFNNYYFDFQGAVYSDSQIMDHFSNLLSQIDTCTDAQLTAQTRSAFDPNNPKHKVVAYFLKNIYVVSRLANDQSLRNELRDELDTWAATQPAGMSDSTYQLKIAVAGYFKNMLTSIEDGDGVPLNIRFVMTDGTTLNTPSDSANAESFAKSLSAITFDIASTASSGTNSYRYEFIAGSAGELLSEGADVVSAVNNSAVEFSRRAKAFEVDTEAKVEDLKQEVSQLISTTAVSDKAAGTSLVNNSAAGTTEALAFTQYTDPTGTEAFVSWSSIESAMASFYTSGDIPITKISPTLLYNSQTDTYAYFSSEETSSKAIALVGTAVITGDSNLGVMFQSGSGEAAELYYHIEAIKALLNGSQENSVVGGLRTMTVGDSTLDGHVENIDVISDSGASNGAVPGVKLLISRDYANDSKNFADDSAFAQSQVVGNSVWGNYISLSQANRIMNVIYRRVTYTSSSGKSNVTGFAVVRYVPVDVEELGTMQVTSNTSLQDLLDAPATEPTDAAAKQIWNTNKEQANAYANWIYGTSGVTYLETGYVRPVATFYMLGDSSDSLPPASLFSPLSPTQQAAVSVVPMGKVYNGASAYLHESVAESTMDTEEHQSAYWLSTDCEAIVSGSRIYLHESLFPNFAISAEVGNTFARLQNKFVKQAAFSLGATFKVDGVEDTLSNGMAQPTITVVGTKSDGTIQCQVGPITGVPITFGSAKAVVYSATSGGTNTLGSYDLTSVSGDNRLVTTFYEMFKGMPEVKNLGISTEPLIRMSKTSVYYVFTGSSVQVYEGGTTRSLADVTLNNSSYSDTLADCITAFDARVSKYGNVHPRYTQTYLNIEFPASKYRVRDGKLQRGESSATEFMSPSLFASLNDMIIDEMINESNGAIPVNEIPEGALLRVGNCYYQAVGNTPEERTYIGYAYLASSVTAPTVQDTVDAFGPQFIRAGNQYVNVSHWFGPSTKILGNCNSTIAEALQNVADQTLRIDDTTKRSVNSLGKTTVIFTAAGGGVGNLYCPMQIQFIDGLMAYPSGVTEEGVSQRYQLCNSAENVVSGSFADLSFFTDKVLDAELYDQTSDLLSSGFVYYEGAANLLQNIQNQFKEALAGDLFTLARMVLFVLVFWLIVASWVCYACKLGNLMPILEAIRHPTGRSNMKGIDLFKIISIGTISLDSEFGLGKFLQYNGILAVLLCVIMLTGN